MADFNILRLVKTILMQFHPETSEFRFSFALSLIGFFIVFAMSSKPESPHLQQLAEDGLHVPVGVVLSAIFAKLVTMSLNTNRNVHPYTWYRKYLMHRRRLKYGNFLFRRLVAQVEQALYLLPKHMDYDDDAKMQCFVDSLDAATCAIERFRHDIDRVLFHWELINDPLPPADFYRIPAHEDMELQSYGYSTIDVCVTDDFLYGLAYG